MNRNSTILVATLLAACGSSDIKKVPDPPKTIVVTNNSSSGTNNGASNNGAVNNGIMANNGIAPGTNNGTEPTAVCAFGERAVGSDCEPVDAFLSLSAAWFLTRDATGEQKGSGISACTQQRVADGVPDEGTFDIITENETCKVWRSNSAVQVFQDSPLETGTISISSSSFQTEFDLGESLSGCEEVYSAPNAPDFGPGTELLVESTGGADFPAFSTTMVLPDALQMQFDDIVAGRDISFTWNGTRDDLVLVWIATRDQADEYVAITCEVPDNGSFTIDSSMTQHLSSTPREINANFYRINNRVEWAEDAMIVTSTSVLNFQKSNTAGP